MPSYIVITLMQFHLIFWRVRYGSLCSNNISGVSAIDTEFSSGNGWCWHINRDWGLKLRYSAAFPVGDYSRFSKEEF